MDFPLTLVLPSSFFVNIGSLAPHFLYIALRCRGLSPGLNPVTLLALESDQESCSLIFYRYNSDLRLIFGLLAM